MPLQLALISDHREILGDDDVRQFNEAGGTIGRALENDWILPDPDRFISGRHATVDYQAGAFYLADTSTNGVYVNGEHEPIGKGNPRRLFDGDRIRMGDFEFAVSLDEGEDLEMPPPEPLTVVPDHIEQLVDEESLKSGIQLLEEEAITGDDVFQSALQTETLNGQPRRKVASAKRSRSKSTAKRSVSRTPAKSTSARIGRNPMLLEFLQAAGVNPSDIHPATDPLEIMANAGSVLRELLNGVTELLASRADVKNLFRLDQTTIMPRHNNPMKVAGSTVDAMKQLLVGKEGEYLAPLDAVREACRDLRFHQDALLDGMVAAFSEFSDRFDPDELEENFDRTLNRKPLIRLLNQLKYWQLYKEIYPIMTQRGSGLFPQHFAEDFVRAYEKQVAECRRLQPTDEELAQRLTPSSYEVVEGDEEALADGNLS